MQEFKGHQEGVNSVSFSPYGKTIATEQGKKGFSLCALEKD
ncbi:hypothetical protein [Atlanticothrix silvestris]